MTIHIQSSIDYQQVCDELGISINDLMQLAQNKLVASGGGKEEPLFKVIDAYLDTLEKKVKLSKRSKTTYITYKNFLLRLKSFALAKDPEFKIHQINETFFYEFLATSIPRKGAAQHSPYTTNKNLSIIRSLLHFALINSYIDQDLRARFDFDKTDTMPRYFNDNQIKQILEVVLKRTYGYRWRAIIIFLLYTGCRINEITNLRVKDFDLDNNLIFVKGKGSKERYVPIYPELKQVVLRYWDMTHLTEWGIHNQGFLFSRDDGDKRVTKISNRSLQYQVKNILSEIGIGNEHYSTHSFRHTYAVNCLKAGMKMEYLSQILGHNSPSTTYIYVRLLPVDLRDEVTKKFPFPFEDLLNEII